MCEGLPSQVKYWLTASTKHDCFFLVGTEEGKTERIGAFKVLLAGHSEVLRNMLEDSDISEQDDVLVTDIEPKTFKLFLKCVYGSADCNSLVESLSFETCLNLLYVVEKYLVDTIKPKLISHMLKLLNFEVCSNKCDDHFLALSSPLCLQNEQLRDVILCFVMFKTEDIFCDDRFLKLPDESLLEIVKLEVLNTSEINIWNALYTWTVNNVNSNDGKILRQKMLKHLKFIRFGAFDLKTFCTKVVSKDILTPEEACEIIKSFHDCYKSSVNLEHICNIATPRRLLTEQDFGINFGAVIFDIKNNIKQLRGRAYSETFQYMSFSWNIMIMKSVKHLGMFLVCNKGMASRNWSCSANGELVLVNQCGKPNFSMNISTTFNCLENDWGFHNFYSWDQLLNPANGFVKDNAIIIMAHLKIE